VLVALDQDRGRFPAMRFPIMKVAYSSDLAGEGNVGKGDNPPICRTKARYCLGLRAADLEGEERPQRRKEQISCVKKTYAMARHLMGLVFDAANKEWDKQIEKAYTLARAEMMFQYKCTKPNQLKDKEAASPEIKEAVRARAREVFIDNAKPLPGAPRDDRAKSDEAEENGAIDETGDDIPTVWLRKNVFPFKKYDPLKDSMSQETGPSLDDMPSTIENWGKILNAMTELKRKYEMIKYQTAKTGAPIGRPPVEITRAVKMGTGKVELMDKMIEDPFFNPCIVDRNGIPQECLVVCSGTWNIYPGPAGSDSTYGVRLDLNPVISIVKRKARPIRTIVVNDDDAVDFVDEIIEPEKPAKKAKKVEVVVVPPEEEAEDGEVAPQEGGEGAGAEDAHVDEELRELQQDVPAEGGGSDDVDGDGVQVD
jgi:hypothetical protein